ncbi:template-activating factor I [Nematocida sp. AWRm77]|nr:template-activating factor I [Nematocida sp. AWRm77]
MNEESVSKKLIDIQNQLDPFNIEQIKKEFKVRLEYYEKMKGILEKRNAISKGIDNFWELAFLNTELAEFLFSVSEEKEESEFLQSSWIKRLVVEYRPEYKCYVAIYTNKNEYFSNNILEKEFSLLEAEDFKHTEIEWTGKKMLDNQLLRFFSDSSSDDDSISMFYSLYDLYVNAVYYYMSMAEENEEEKGSCSSDGEETCTGHAHAHTHGAQEKDEE